MNLVVQKGVDVGLIALALRPVQTQIENVVLVDVMILWTQITSIVLAVTMFVGYLMTLALNVVSRVFSRVLTLLAVKVAILVGKTMVLPSVVGQVRHVCMGHVVLLMIVVAFINLMIVILTTLVTLLNVKGTTQVLGTLGNRPRQQWGETQETKIHPHHLKL